MMTLTDKEYNTLVDCVKGMVYGRCGTYNIDIVKDAVMDSWGAIKDSGLEKQSLLRYWARSATNRYFSIARLHTGRQQRLVKNTHLLGTKETPPDTVYRSLEMRERIQELIHADDRKYAAYILTLVSQDTGEDLRKIAEAWFRENISPTPDRLRVTTKRIRDWVLALG